MKLSLLSRTSLLSALLGGALLFPACSSEEPVTINEGTNTGGTSSSGGATSSGGSNLGGDGGAAGGPNSSGTPVERYGHLRVIETSLVGEDGNPVQLKGISSQWLNWEDDGYALNLEALEWMRDNWNLSLIRAAMGAESDAPGSYLDANNPAAGKADMLRQVKIIVDNAIQAGVYVIIDFHSHSAHLHEDEAADFFKQMMELYGHTPNVLLEPFNEPKDVSPSEPLDWPELKSYHEAIVATIRESDTDEHGKCGDPRNASMVTRCRRGSRLTSEWKQSDVYDSLLLLHPWGVASQRGQGSTFRRTPIICH
jgi:hypothetical protein